MGVTIKLPIILDNQSNAFFKVNFNDTIIDSLHFDSGMGKLYDMNISTAKKLIVTFKDEKNNFYKGYGISGQGILGNAQEEETYLINTKFKLGNHIIENAQIGTTPTVSRIGRELLNHGILTIDYIRKQYSFEKYPHRLNHPKPNFGFEIITEENKVIVGVVWENTKAQKAGLVSGTEIKEINGIAFNSKSSCEIEKILEIEFSKKKLRITYLKSGIEKTRVFGLIKNK